MAEVTVQLFAGARAAFGSPTVRVDLGEGGTVGDLCDRLREAHPDAVSFLATCRVAVNQEFASPEHPVPTGAEVALIPPVSGG